MAEALSIDVMRTVRIAAISISFERKVDDDIYTQISRSIRKTLKNKLSGSAFRTATRMICIVDEEKTELLIPTFERTAKGLRERYGCEIHIGVANIPATLHLRENYERASAALDMAVARGELLVRYDEFDLDFLMGEIPEETCRRYLTGLFGRADASIASDMEFSGVYLEENGSLTAIGERLFLHKTRSSTASQGLRNEPESTSEPATARMCLRLRSSCGTDFPAKLPIDFAGVTRYYFAAGTVCLRNGESYAGTEI